MKYEKLPKEFKNKWVAALRSGAYEQGQERLKRGSAYCCLGVACVVAGVKKIHGNMTFIPHKDHDDDGAFNLVPDSIRCESRTSSKLAGMNDDGCSFGEIADWIDENL